MKKIDFQNNTGIQTSIYGLLFIGFLLRIAVWLQQRSIFLDEANLLRNYAERDYIGLFKDLDYQQYAPPLFSMAMKACMQLFGNDELGVKMFPLFCGGLMLWFFYRLSVQILSPQAVFAALFWVALGKIFIDYSTEAKQYATDACVSIGLLYLSSCFKIFPFQNKQILFWIIIGCVSIWLSMPSIFILAGIGLYFLSKYIDFKHNYTGLLVMGASWVFSFLAYFFLLLKNNAQSDYLQNFHQAYFLAFPPTNLNQFQLLGTQITGILSNLLGWTFIANVLTIIGLSTGIYQLWTMQRDWFIRLVIPIITVLIASATHFYSLIPRLTLFFLPILILIVFMGYDFIFKKINNYIKIIFIIAFVITGYNFQCLSNFYKPFLSETADLKKGLEYLAAEQAQGEPFFVPHNIVPVAQYYRQFYDKPFSFLEPIFQNYRCCDADIMEQDLKKIHEKGFKKVWIILENDTQTLFNFVKKMNGKILKEKKFHRGIIILYQIP